MTAEEAQAVQRRWNEIQSRRIYESVQRRLALRKLLNGRR